MRSKRRTSRRASTPCWQTPRPPWPPSRPTTFPPSGAAWPAPWTWPPSAWAWHGARSATSTAWPTRPSGARPTTPSCPKSPSSGRAWAPMSACTPSTRPWTPAASTPSKPARTSTRCAALCWAAPICKVRTKNASPRFKNAKPNSHKNSAKTRSTRPTGLLCMWNAINSTACPRTCSPPRLRPLKPKARRATSST